MSKNIFEGEDFAIQLMAKGSFVDNGAGSPEACLVEAFTIRLNHVALNAWILSEMFNTQDCFDTHEEWEEHKAKYSARREAVEAQIIRSLDIDSSDGGISITQSQSEVFTVVHISKITN